MDIKSRGIDNYQLRDFLLIPRKIEVLDCWVRAFEEQT